MKTAESRHEQDLKAVAYCAQSDGYLQKWAREKMDEMADKSEGDKTPPL